MVVYKYKIDAPQIDHLYFHFNIFSYISAGFCSLPQWASRSTMLLMIKLFDTKLFVGEFLTYCLLLHDTLNV